jgi:hypothetical protein
MVVGEKNNMESEERHITPGLALSKAPHCRLEARGKLSGWAGEQIDAETSTVAGETAPIKSNTAPTWEAQRERALHATHLQEDGASVNSVLDEVDRAAGHGDARIEDGLKGTGRRQHVSKRDRPKELR